MAERPRRTAQIRRRLQRPGIPPQQAPRHETRQMAMPAQAPRMRRRSQHLRPHPRPRRRRHPRPGQPPGRMPALPQPEDRPAGRRVQAPRRQPRPGPAAPDSLVMLTVVTGPPCAGKTTYVQKHARPGDVVVDFDDIAQALGSPVAHGHGGHHWKVAIEARDAAITAAEGCHQQGARVWIIDSRPAPSRRAWYARQGARLVDLTASPAELHRRADQAGRPADWHGRIDQFLAVRPAQAGDPVARPRTAW